ncbi:MAG: rRNA maturation RNase YbeY [Chitinophagales bacterium]|nr:rRNA maturation RNase YbeY [Chitinophagales bacterium]
MAVHFYYVDIDVSLRHKKLLKEFITQQFFKFRKKKLSLSVIFCSDDYLLRINQHFLGHDFYTDVITFPLEEKPTRVTAEIYISVERVWDNSRKPDNDFYSELLRVLFHGLIHLCGRNDKTKQQALAMREEEDKWLADYATFIKKTTSTKERGCSKN